jgi:hypothetical protein
VRIKLYRRGLNWGGRIMGGWLEIIAGPYRLDLYWEPVNNWHKPFHARWAISVGRFTAIAQNWRNRDAR